MIKKRLYEVASELGIESRTLISKLQSQGVSINSASGYLDESIIDQLLSSKGSQIATPPLNKINTSTNDSKHAIPTPPTPLTATPASILSGWRAGPVTPPRDPDLLANIERLKRKFHQFETHVRLLAELGSQVVYAGSCKIDGFRDCGVAMVRFSSAIESAFGLTREVMLFYSRHKDLQVRTFQAAKQVPITLGREVTPDIMFFSSPDPRLSERLDDWTKNGTLLAIPLEEDTLRTPLDFIKLIRDYIYSRDLFYETTPVQGDRFFGRRVLLQGLRDDVREQRVAGLFGLRKAGKTSVLLQLANDLKEEGVVSVLVDLEYLPSPPEDPIPDLLTSLRFKLIEELKSSKLRTKELSDCPQNPSISQFRNSLNTLLRKIPSEELRMMVVMLDEIEYLTPSDRVDVAEGNMPQISQFLGSMRSLVQETENFTFLLSGLTSQIVESGRLYGRPNPLFSWAKTHHLSPFTESEASELARSVGARMGIEIEDGALEALFQATGGHAYLYRNLASTVVESLPLDVFRRRMTKSTVLGSLEGWRLNVAGNLEEMLDHVKRYYPTESILLEFLLEDPDSFSSLAYTEPKAIHHLISLGLIEHQGRDYAASTVLELLR